MAKTYTLQGPIMLENLTNTQALGFVATVIAEVPAHAMGTASVNIRAQGPSGTGTKSTTVSGKSVDELKAALAKAQSAPKAPEDICYDVRGHVNLVGMSHAECLDLIDTTMNAIPVDLMVFTTMVIQQETA